MLTASHGLAGRLAGALDPVQLARRCGIAPDAWQAAVLRSAARRHLLLCSRQSGKSTVTALMAAHETLYRPDSLVLLLSPSLRQSQELFRKVLDVYQAAGAPVPATVENKLSLELANGARVVALPGSEKTIRGFSGPSLVILDEAARIEDALFEAVSPMLAVSGGRLVLLTTAYGKRGVFFHAWTEGGEQWQRTRIPADQCPRIGPAWLEEERRRLPVSVFAQEYECIFSELDDAAFSYTDIHAALAPELAPL